jgi:hypothetical protein
MSWLCLLFGHVPPQHMDKAVVNRMALGEHPLKISCMRCDERIEQTVYVLYRDQIADLSGPKRRWRNVMFIVKDRPLLSERANATNTLERIPEK